MLLSERNITFDSIMSWQYFVGLCTMVAHYWFDY